MKSKTPQYNIFATLSIVVLLIGIITPTTAQQEPVTITFWEWFGGALGDFLEEEAKRFHEKNPEITIEVSHYPDQQAYREALALAFKSENAPDTFVPRHRLSQLIENEWIQPLDPWIKPEWLAKFPEGSFVETRNTWEGKIYAFPTEIPKVDRVFFINEDIFREAGLVDQAGNITPPQTWGELRTMAKQVTEAGKGKYYGIGIGIKDPKHMNRWLEFSSLAGGPGSYEIDLRTGRFTFGSDPAYTDIVELLLGMKEDGSVYLYESTLDDSNLYAFFGQGKYAMFMSGSYAANNLNRDFPDFQNYQMVPIPIPDEGRKGGMPIVAGSGSYFMSSQTKHPDEAWMWLDWISSHDFHERMVTQGLGFSVYAELNTPQNIPDPKKWRVYEAITQYVVFMPFPPALNPAATLVVPERVIPDASEVLIGIYTGQIKDWKQALKDLEERKQAALEAAIQKAREQGADVSIEDFIFPDWDPMKNYVPQTK
jgi:ABC-type glycerol-3-phosphate transport system substrate-binding protein